MCKIKHSQRLVGGTSDEWSFCVDLALVGLLASVSLSAKWSCYWMQDKVHRTGKQMVWRSTKDYISESGTRKQAVELNTFCPYPWQKYLQNEMCDIHKMERHPNIRESLI